MSHMSHAPHPLRCIAQIPLVASLYDTLRHDKHDVVRVVTCCVVRAAPCLFQHSGRRSSRVRVYNAIVFYYLLFQLTNKINSFIETNYADHKCIHITNKLSCVSCLWRSWRWTCRACCRATQHARVFPIPKCIG